jgi:predicted permease
MRRGSARAAYRAWLRLLPGAFRERHGHEMEAMFLEALIRARESGVTSVLRVWVLAAWDILRRAPVERVRGHTRATKRRRVPVFIPDLRFALRSFRRQPATTSLVVGMLALGIAANTAVFTLLNGLYLRPFPFPEPDRLVYLNETAPRWNLEYTGINYPDFHRWREDARVFEGMALFEGAAVNLSDDAGAERVEGLVVTHDFASVLGIVPLLGRTFTAEEDRPQAPPVVMLGYALWRDRFGGAPDVVGRSLRVNSLPHTVVGVLPPEGDFPGNVAMWLPLKGDPEQSWQSYSGGGVGRLKAGITVEAAHQDLMRAHTPIFEERDDDRVVTPRVLPLREFFVSDLRTASLATAAAVAMVLLIACANVAALMLARALSRRREMGIRMAMGAGTGRLLRQLFTENLVYSVLGGAIGLLLGAWASRALASTIPDQFPQWVRFDLDVRVVGFACAASALTAVLFGVTPAFHAFRGDLRGALQESGARSTATRSGRRTLGFLIAGEVALAAMLLVGGGLLIRAYHRMQAIDPGFRAENVLTFGVALPSATYETEQQRQHFWEEFVGGLSVLPGVASAGAITCPPLGCHWGSFVEAEGAAPRRPNDPDPVILNRIATPGYFETMGVRLLHGRFFDEHDGRDEGSKVLIVNETFARLHWPNDPNPVGKRVRGRGSDPPPPWLTVVGVTRDVRHYGVEKPMRPGMYQPLPQNPVSGMIVVVRAVGDATALVSPARQLLGEMDADLPMYRIGTMEEAVRRSLALRQSYSWLLSIFAAVALLLAVGGLYGVTSYAVSQQTREIGIRVALGAHAGQVTRSVLRGGIALVTAGLSIGLLGGLASARALSTLLAGVEPTDLTIYAGVALLLLATALIANWIPARRAARIDAMVSLRSE